MLEFGPWILGLNSPISLMRSNNKAAQVYWCYRQILKISDGDEVDTKLGLFRAFLDHFRDDSANSKKYKAFWTDLD